MSRASRRRPAVSHTRTRLRWLFSAVLLSTALVLVSTLAVFLREQRTAETVRDRTTPVILEVAAARAALVYADREAMASFRNGEAQLAGPGQRFQSEIALASQSLAQAAEDNAAGATGSRQLQLVEGLLVSYSSRVEQTDASVQQAEDSTLGVVDLWYASRLLHDPGDGILAELDQLSNAEQHALYRQVTGRTTTWPWLLVWLLPQVVLSVALLLTQALFVRWFRRGLNLALLAATACLAWLSWNMFDFTQAQQQLTQVRHSVAESVSQWRAASSTVDGSGQRILAELLARECGGAPGAGCGDTVAGFIDRIGRTSGNAAVTEPVIGWDDTVGRQTRATASHSTLAGVVTAFSLGIGGLTVWGFRPRFEEYRYRSQ